MSSVTSHLYFPNSGLSINRAKKRAKEAVKAGTYPTLNDALNAIALDEMGLPWAKTIAKLNDLADNSIPRFMTRSDIQAVMKDIPELTHFGFGAYRDRSQPYKEYLKSVEDNRQALLNAVDECNKACMYLRHLEKRKTINWNSGSYGLKHAVEYYLKRLDAVENPYVANGSFICAAHFMGFTVKQNGYDSPNACINFSMKSPIVKWRKLAEERMMVSTKGIRELDSLEKELGLPRSQLVEDHQYFLK